MSNPSSKRPLPPEVYRRRRIAALVIALVVVLFIAWLTKSIVSSVGSKDAASTSELTSSETSTSASAESSASQEPSGSEKATATDASESEKPKPSETDKASEKTTCELADLVITASSDQVSYKAGVQPKLYITVKNPTKADCEIDLDQNKLRFEVFSLASNQRIWSDVDCHESVGFGQEKFAAGKEKSYEAVWSRRVSAPEKCSAADRPEAKPGPYFLHGLIGENASEAHTFNLQ